MKADRTFDTGILLHTMYHWVSKTQWETVFLVLTWSLETLFLLTSFFFPWRSGNGLGRGL